jgi:hypothetical protein
MSDDRLEEVLYLRQQVTKLETALREAREAMLGVCKRHCLIKSDDMCVAEDCPASPYRTTGTEE